VRVAQPHGAVGGEQGARGGGFRVEDVAALVSFRLPQLR
jgi:hypothetical protein